jgi:hypothetical protein
MHLIHGFKERLALQEEAVILEGGALARFHFEKELLIGLRLVENRDLAPGPLNSILEHRPSGWLRIGGSKQPIGFRGFGGKCHDDGFFDRKGDLLGQKKSSGKGHQS